MAERMTSRDEADFMKDAIMRTVDALERSGLERGQIGAAMVGIGGGIVAAHLGSASCLSILDSTRNALLSSEQNH